MATRVLGTSTVLIVGLGCLASAQTTQDWAFTVQSAAVLELPKDSTFDSALRYLDYEPGESVFGLLADLNGDGTDDYLIRSSTRICGNAGCSYALVDGKQLERLGVIFGNPIVVRWRLINGYPVVNACGHTSADSGTYGTFVFDGDEYVLVSGVHLSGDALTDLFAEIDEVPHR